MYIVSNNEANHLNVVDFEIMDQLFWNSQVERYISNQLIIAEKKRGSIHVGNDTVFDILLLSYEGRVRSPS